MAEAVAPLKQVFSNIALSHPLFFGGWQSDYLS